MKIVSKPIDAIVVFRGKNKPQPYKFRYTESNGESREIVVEKILLSYEQKLAGIKTLVYECQSDIDDYERRYQLKYLISECRWELYKI